MRTCATEKQEQVKLFQWAAYNKARFPVLAIMNASLMGVKISKFQQIKAKQSGCKTGWPDIVIPTGRHHYFSLYIELKAKNGKVSITQDEILWKLNFHGNLAMVCYGADEAIALIEAYLGNNKEKLNELIGCLHD